MISKAEFVRLVDHTLLAQDAAEDQVRAVCQEARELGVRAVCVNSYWVPLVHGELVGSDVLTCSVVGFPLGAMLAEAVANEAKLAAAAGADEIDMVIPIGLVKAGNMDGAKSYVSTVRAACPGVTLKVILETALLTDEEIIESARLAVDAGADFVKTSTGFNKSGGATTHAVQLLRQTVGPNVGVKASGGIRTLADVEAMFAAGASRLGLSATLSIINEIDYTNN